MNKVISRATALLSLAVTAFLLFYMSRQVHDTTISGELSKEFLDQSHLLTTLFSFGFMDRDLLPVEFLSGFSILATVFLVNSFLPLQMRVRFQYLAFIGFFLFYNGFSAFLFFTFLVLTLFIFFHPRTPSFKLTLTVYGISFLGVLKDTESLPEQLTLTVLIVLSTAFMLASRRMTLPKKSFLLPVLLFFGTYYFTRREYFTVSSLLAHKLTFVFFLSFGLRILYHYFDLRDFKVKAELELESFLAHFILIPDFLLFDWWTHPGQGLHYLKETWLNDDENKIMLKGSKSVFLGVWYLFFLVPIWTWLMKKFCFMLGFDGFRLTDLYQMYLTGQHVPRAQFFTLMIGEMFLESFFLFGFLHFKVGLYRLFGFNLKSYTDFPWLATNLSEFWKRWGYHFMPLILRGFYLPIFLRLRNMQINRRKLLSTFYAVMFGQFVALIPFGVDFGSQFKVLAYAFALAIGIAISLVYEDSSAAKTWQWNGKLPVDMLKTAVIVSYFALAHLFLIPGINSVGHWAGKLLWWVLFPGR